MSGFRRLTILEEAGAGIGVLLAVGVMWLTPTQAHTQLPTGAASPIPSRATTDSAMGTPRTRLLAQENAGKRRIASGQATTIFQPGQADPQMAAYEIPSGNEEDLYATEEPETALQKKVDDFNRRMGTYGLRVNDLADGLTMAYALCYEAKNNRRPDSTQVKRRRAKIRNIILTSSSFQGMSDAEWQKIYEQNAIGALKTFALREQARKTSDPAVKRVFIERARQNAANMGLTEKD